MLEQSNHVSTTVVFRIAPAHLLFLGLSCPGLSLFKLSFLFLWFVQDVNELSRYLVENLLRSGSSLPFPAHNGLMELCGSLCAVLLSVETIVSLFSYFPEQLSYGALVKGLDVDYVVAEWHRHIRSMVSFSLE